MGWVIPDPSPPHRLSQRGAQHDVDSGHRPRRQRLALRPTRVRQVGIQLVDPGCRQRPERDRSDVGVEVAVDHGSGLADRCRGPGPRRHGEPPLQQRRQRRARPAGTLGSDCGHQSRQFTLGLDSGAPHGGGPVALLAGLGIDPGIDPELPRTRRSLPHRTDHTPTMADSATVVMGIDMGTWAMKRGERPRRGPLTWGFMERTTRFEPATLTLAR